MKIYEEIFNEVEALCASSSFTKLKDSKPWKEGDKNQLIFKEDTAFELGGGLLEGLSGVILTSSPSKISQDEVILIGNDLNKIKEDTPYARIALVLVDEDKMGKGNILYQAIRRVDYCRYRMNPEGFMLRISQINQKESARVSKLSLKKGMNFASLGKYMIDQYKQNPQVKNVKMIFVTDPSFDFKKLQTLLNKNDNITKALDHLLNKVNMDCHSCKLQPICEEVEEMVNNDFN